MTILPKKKQSKEKTEGEKGGEHQPSPHSPPSESRVGSRRPPSPPAQWNAPADERLTPHVDPGGIFDEFAPHDSTSNHNKRRHRSSPHRSSRKHRYDRHDRGPSHSSSQSSAQSSHSHRHTVRAASSTSSESSTDNAAVEEGYNSGDEYVEPIRPQTEQEYEELEKCFEKALKEERAFLIRRMREDGACLFRAVADQIYGDQEMHATIRQNCVDYMAKNHDFFKHYITEDFSLYLSRKRAENCHGNHVEIQAISEVYNRPLEVYQYSTKPINTFHGAYKTDNEPIRLSYHRNRHYNSIVDPYKATIGVGLGLPGLQPGLADRNLVRDATIVSENTHIEQTMLEDKLRQTDWELTQESMEEQVARESYLQWLREQEKRATSSQSSSRSVSATCTTAAEGQDAWWDEPPRPASLSPHPLPSSSPPGGQMSPSAVPGCSGVNRPPPQTPSSQPHSSHQEPTVTGACGFSETSSIMNALQPQLFGLSDWDEDDVMSRVLAQSHQEYLDNLKRQASSSSPSPASPSSSHPSCSHNSS